jgi:hypothetical protein
MIHNKEFYESAGYLAFRLGHTALDGPTEPTVRAWWLCGYNKAVAKRAAMVAVGGAPNRNHVTATGQTLQQVQQQRNGVARLAARWQERRVRG